MADSGTSAPSRLNSLLASGTTLVAIVASLVNVWLTVQSQQIQREVQKREEELQNLESEIKRGQAASSSPRSGPSAIDSSRACFRTWSETTPSARS